MANQSEMVFTETSRQSKLYDISNRASMGVKIFNTSSITSKYIHQYRALQANPRLRFLVMAFV